MINPPQGSDYNSQAQFNVQPVMPPPPVDAVLPSSNSGVPVIPVSDDLAIQIVAQCNKFKTAVITHAKSKKQTMRRCYAYWQSQFFGDDLLPRPYAEGQQNDNNQSRSELFMPITRELVKQLLAQLVLSICPNNEDYFRVRAEDQDGAPFENELTEGLKYVFRKSQIRRRIEKYLQCLAIFGNGVAYPTRQIENNWVWDIDIEAMQFVPSLSRTVSLDIEVWNPLHFYIDPYAKRRERASWGYFSIRKVCDLIDDPAYINTNKIKDIGFTDVRDSQTNDPLDLSQFNDTLAQYQDIDKNVKFDQYYFPYLKLDNGKEFRNILVAVANETILVQLKPNMSRDGMNPVEFETWCDDIESPYGTGPVEDGSNLQQLINIKTNYKTEVMSRIGNRFIARENVDLSNFFGAAGGVAISENPREDMIAMTGEYIEIEALDNSIGVMKAEMETLMGTQDPFQGSSQVDYQKTATEINVLQANSIGTSRNIQEHISMSIERIFTRLMYEVADLYKEPLKIRVDSPMGTQYQKVDFSLLKQFKFVIELTGVNPAQSKEAQVESLTQLIQLLVQAPQAVMLLEPILEQIGDLQGIKDIDYLLDQLKQRLGVMNAQAVPPGQPGVQGQVPGVLPAQAAGMEGVPPPGIGAQGQQPGPQAA